MCRVYRLIGQHRYYLNNRRFWTEYAWEAQVLRPEEAARVAQAESALVEPMSSPAARCPARRPRSI